MGAKKFSVDSVPRPKKKKIFITFECHNHSEIRSVFVKIFDQLKDGVQSNEGTVNGVGFAFSQEYEQNMAFQIKNIDGESCKVFKSSI